MREFKYTEKEIRDLVDWFKDKNMPKSLRLDSGTFIPDTAKTVELMREIILENQVYSFEPTVMQLMRIKDLVERYNAGEDVPQE